MVNAHYREFWEQEDESSDLDPKITVCLNWHWNQIESDTYEEPEAWALDDGLKIRNKRPLRQNTQDFRLKFDIPPLDSRMHIEECLD